MHNSFNNYFNNLLICGFQIGWKHYTLRTSFCNSPAYNKEGGQSVVRKALSVWVSINGFYEHPKNSLDEGEEIHQVIREKYFEIWQEPLQNHQFTEKLRTQVSSKNSRVFSLWVWSCFTIRFWLIFWGGGRSTLALISLHLVQFQGRQKPYSQIKYSKAIYFQWNICFGLNSHLCVRSLRERPSMTLSLCQQKRRFVKHGKFYFPWASKLKCS